MYSSYAQQQIELYKDFRAELDKMCVPVILASMLWTESIIQDKKQVGLLCFCEEWDSVKNETYYYIDCLYIVPAYRKKGLAKKAVLKWYKQFSKRNKPIRLHIINNNSAAIKFWNSLFTLRIVDRNRADTLYEIVNRNKEAE